MFSRSRRTSAGTARRQCQPPSVGCGIEPKEPPTIGRRSEEVNFGMASTRLLSKGTFALEMHLTPQVTPVTY